MLFAACGDDTKDTPAAPATDTTAAATDTSAAPTEKKKIKVGLAFDIGGRGDKSFNDSAAVGLDKVKSELDVEVQELSAKAGETDADKEARLKLLADGDFDPIVAVGFAYATALGKVAPKYPDTTFGIIDDATVKAPNVVALVFSEEQGSFLVGAAAALKSKTNSLGYIGGVEVPLLKKFQAGFAAGAKQIKPDVKIQVKYLTQPPDFTGFNDPAKGKETARGMFDQGADVIYAAAGGSGTGVFEAAKAANGLAIGVDSDAYLSAAPAVKDVIITSMIKRVDVAVFTFVKSVADGTFKAGEERFDLSKEGVGYSTSGGKIDDIKAQLEDLKQQIIDGKIKVPEAP